MLGARRYSYRPWSFAWTITRSGESSARSHPPFVNVFGVKKALDYLVGQKLLNFAEAADEDPDFAAELPRFQAAVWEIFNPYELRGYVASLKPAARKKLQKLLYVSS